MPSIPQSLLWISLVVLWLFVLVPMLINKRDTVRRTSDLALSTRVVNSASRSRLLRRRGPATGHRHDPDWRPEDVDLDEDYQDYPAEDYDEAVREAMQEASSRDGRGQTRSAMVLAAVNESEANTEPVYIDVDVVDENSGALPVGDGVQADGVQESLFEQPPGDAGADAACTMGRVRGVGYGRHAGVSGAGEPGRVVCAHGEGAQQRHEGRHLAQPAAGLRRAY